MGIRHDEITTQALLAQAGWLNALARQLVADPHVAADVVQETFSSALASSPPLDRGLRPWLARVARNAARMRARSESARTARERSRGVPDDGLSPSDLAEKLECQRLLVDAVRELHEPYRATILLHYWEHRTSDEIAALHGVPAGTVRWRLKQGVDLLRERLDARHAGDRRAWCALLAPLAAPDAKAALAPTTLLAGILSMKILVKAAVVVVLVALGTGVWFAARSVLDAGDERTLSRERVAVEFRPLAASAEEALASAPESSRVEAPAIGAAAVASAPEETAHVEARVLDPKGRAIPGARIAWRGSTRGSLPKADTLGNVRGDLDLDADATSLSFTVKAFACATRVVEAAVARGKTTYLGDIVLQPGGVVSGRAVDLDGHAVKGARIGIDAVDIPRSELSYRSPSRHVDEPSTESLADGSFVLEGAPVGLARVIGVSDEHLPGYSGIVEIRRGTESAGVVLELEPIPTDQWVRGIVLDPEGQPVPHATLLFQARTSTGTSSGSRSVGDDGRFREVVRPGSSLTLVAHDKRERWSDVAAPDAKPGGADVVLRFKTQQPIEVHVSSSAGGDVENYSVSAWSVDHRLSLAQLPPGARAGGKARVLALAMPFVVIVKAPGHLDGQVGPFDPASAPTSIEVILEAIPGISGRVIGLDGPVRGARVSLFSTVDQYTEKDGFPVFVEPSPSDTTQTSDDGSFRLTPRSSGECVVRAEVPGSAPDEARVPRFDIRRGVAGLELHLSKGGSIEGRVLVPPGRATAGTIVAISRGDGFARTQRVGPDGAFAFERLMPGRWDVRESDAEISPERSRSRTRSRSAREMPWKCEVAIGRTTHFDLDLWAARAACILIGTLRVRGADLGTWTATWRHQDDTGSGGIQAPVQLDEAGTFQLGMESPAKMTIILTALDGPFDGLRIFSDVDVPAGRSQSDIAFDAAKISVVAARPQAMPALIAHLVALDGHTLAIRPIATDAGPAERAVPSGEGRIVAPPIESAPKDPRKWPTLVEVTLVPGEARRVTLP